jgi:hypothetical protein
MLNGKNHPEKSASVDFHLAKSRFRRQIDSNLFYPKIEFPIIKACLSSAAVPTGSHGQTNYTERDRQLSALFLRFS